MSWDAVRQRLNNRRVDLGRTQAEVARSMGTTQSAVSDLEAGRTKDPGLNTIARWAAAVDLSMAVQLSEVVAVTMPIVPRYDETEEPA